MKVLVEKVWQQAAAPQTEITALADALGVPPIVARLLYLRGAVDAELARAFLSPSEESFTDPDRFTDMDAAVDRLSHARDRGEAVLVFGDYDVDGMAAVALLVEGLKRFGIADCRYALPDRLTDGYGIAAVHVDDAKKAGIDVIVTVDNGINARDAANRANELGIDLIVTDHHDIEGELPNAAAVINPKRESDPEIAFLCGAAMAFHLVHALTGERHDIDLAALATIADVMPLLGENRAIVSAGLRQMGSTPRPGLAALMQKARIDPRTLRAEDVAFYLAPRINAGGRLADGSTALELLMTKDASKAAALAKRLDDYNVERRRMEKEIFDAALPLAEEQVAQGQCSIVIAQEGWHPGVIGIVAGRLQRRFGLPTILLGIDEDGLAKGSGRSTPVLDMVEALSACQEHLEKFGGHRAAGGMTVKPGAAAQFAEAFCAKAQELLGVVTPSETIVIDGQVALSQIDGALVKAMEQLEPFGHGNPAPVFCSLGVQVAPRSARDLQGKHVRFTAHDGASRFTAIGFGMADDHPPEFLPPALDIAFTPQFNTWRGETSIQLVLKDMRPAQAS